MNKSERLKFISEEVNKYGSIRIADTAQKLNVTRETIRHDIAELDKKGVIQSIRGGAVNPYGLENTRFGQRQTLHLAEKQEIAKKALQFIRNNDHIFLDSGTTSWQLAEAIKHSKIERLTVVTNSTFVIATLQFVKGIQLILLGGTVRTSEGSVSGAMALQNIENIYVDTAFFGSSGINKLSGITNPYMDEIEASKKIRQHSQINIVLADKFKFQRSSLYKMFDLKDVDAIITDKSINKTIIKELCINNILY